MTKERLVKLLLCVLCIVAMVLSFVVPLIACYNVAHADYIDIMQNPNAIINFNQYVKNDFVVSHTFSGGVGVNYVTDYTMVENHIYYVRLVFDAHDNNTLAYRDNANHWVGLVNFDELLNLHYEGLFTCSVDNAALYIYTRTHSSIIKNFNLIDLTQMFGSGNEPNLSQCEDLFVADYYLYNIGTAVSVSGLNAYAEGVQSVYDTLVYNYVGEDSYNLLQSYAFWRGATYYNGAPSKEQSNLAVAALDGDGWTSGNGFALYYPFTSSLVAGDTIVLNGMLGSATDYGTHQQATTYIIIRYGDNIYDILSVNSIVLQDADTYNINSFNYTLPSDATGLVFYSVQPFRIKDFTIQVKSLSVNSLVDSAYRNGYKKASDEYVAYYSQGGAGYNAIYNAGYQAFPNEDHFTFATLISSAIDTPIKAFTTLFDFDILGVNMKTFYLSIFTLCVIVVVIRLVL